MAMESNFSVEYLHGVIHEEEGSPICLIDKISQKGESEEEKVKEEVNTPNMFIPIADNSSLEENKVEAAILCGP